jgi:double-stranded RNA-specific adenosine deaminase
MSQQQVQENSIQQQQQQPSKQQQYHKSGSVRHAEKRRIGTCPFADRIARISIQTYHERVPEKWREENKQVCLATIVAHTRSSRNPGDGNDDECGGNLQVLGMGVGTKFLSEKILQEEKQKHVLVGSINICTASTVSGNDIGTTIVDTHHPVFSSCYGMKIRDSHAEVLARRAFRRKIALEMKSHLLGQCVANPILTLRPTFKNDALETRPGNEKEETSKVIFSLAPGVTIHMYTSSAPCGNSCLKKFAKMSRERYDSSLGIDEWPVDAHEPIGGHSIHLGRFSLLVKKDNHASFSSTQQANTTDQSMKENNMSYRIPIKQQKWPANMNDQWCPPGTTLPHMGRGSIHTCSDKICRWNVIGLQGSLLSSLLHGPIYMETITIGRKFTKCIAQRAVCCRVDGGGTWKGIKRKRNEHKSQVETSNHEEFLNPSLYTVHHPTVMGTSVYMDDLGE